MADTVDDVDFLVGGLLEEHHGGSKVGPLFRRAICTRLNNLQNHLLETSSQGNACIMHCMHSFFVDNADMQR